MATPNNQPSVITDQPSSSSVILNPSCLTENLTALGRQSRQLSSSKIQDDYMERAGSPASNYSYSEALFAVNKRQAVERNGGLNGRCESQPDGSTSLALSMYDLMASDDSLSIRVHRDELKQTCCFDIFSWKKSRENSYALEEPVMLKLKIKPQEFVSSGAVNTFRDGATAVSLSDVVRQDRSLSNTPGSNKPGSAEIGVSEDQISQNVSVGSISIHFDHEPSSMNERLNEEQNNDRSSSLTRSLKHPDVESPSEGVVFDQQINAKKDISIEATKPHQKYEPARLEPSIAPAISNCSSKASYELSGHLADSAVNNGCTGVQKQADDTLLQTNIDTFSPACVIVSSETSNKSIENCSRREKRPRRSKKSLQRHAVSQTSIRAKPTDLDAAERSLRESISMRNLSIRRSVRSRDSSPSSSRENSTRGARAPFGSEDNILSRQDSFSSGSSIDTARSSTIEGSINDTRSNSVLASARSSLDSVETKREKPVLKPTNLDEARASTELLRVTKQFSFQEIDDKTCLPEVHPGKPNSLECNS